MAKTVLKDASIALAAALLSAYATIYWASWWQVRANLVGSEHSLWQEIVSCQKELAGDQLNSVFVLTRELRALKSQKDVHNILSWYSLGDTGSEQKSINFMINDVDSELQNSIERWHHDASTLRFRDSEQRLATVRLLAFADWLAGKKNPSQKQSYEQAFQCFDSQLSAVGPGTERRNAQTESGPAKN